MFEKTVDWLFDEGIDDKYSGGYETTEPPDNVSCKAGCWLVSLPSTVEVLSTDNCVFNVPVEKVDDSSV